MSINLRDYQITFRRALYQRDLWLRTPQALIHWFWHCEACHRRRAREARQ